MAASPRWKVYTAEGEYLASVRYPEDAAALLALRGEGATLRDGHNPRAIVWTEGVTGNAAESYDAVAEAAYARDGR